MSQVATADPNADLYKTGITNYDVLVEPPIPGMSTEFSLAKPEDHVGNQRLQVFMGMYKDSYGDARKRLDDDECDRIVGKIVTTVCHECIPRGRFLVCQSASVSNGVPVIQWHQIGEENVKDILHKSLTLQTKEGAAEDDDEAARRRSSASDAAAAAEIAQTFAARFGSSMPNDNDLDDGQKRRRRSSLLRRSVSESAVGLIADNKKKSNRSGNDPNLFGSQEVPASWKTARSSEMGITSVNRLDVVLTPERDALDPNTISVGNNRLHVFIAMSSSRFAQGSIDEQEEVLDEVLRMVSVFWMGRFLVIAPGGYEELDKDEAREAMNRIYQERSGKSPVQPVGRFKRHSAPMFGADFSIGASPSTGAGASIPQSGKRSSTSALFPGAKNISTGMFPPTMDVDKLRSNAVKSLQKQKARQNMANRLQRMGDSLPVFPLGGKVQPSSFSFRSSSSSAMPDNDVSSSSNNVKGKRNSTVIDASTMEKLALEFGDADCNDDCIEPVPLPDTFDPRGNNGGPGSVNRGNQLR